MIKSIFLKTNNEFPLIGQLIKKEEAPKFFEKIEEICKKIETNAPDHIIVGVEDNFFVTENTVLLNGEKISGRTLYISIFHLGNLSKDETNAILAHEMAHFAGQDTFFSKKTAPMITRINIYFEILSENLITLPIFYFLLFFRSIFEISFGKISREREFRADEYAISIIGAESFVNSLVKFTVYSNFRAKLENDFFNKNEKNENINFIEEIRNGFHDFASNYDFDSTLLNQTIHHPFDTHPPFALRLKASKLEIVPKNLKELFKDKVEDSWFNEIKDADLILNQLMTEYENRFKEAHERDLAYRYLPENDAEREIVEKYFQKIDIMLKNKNESFYFDYEKITYSEWLKPIYFTEIDTTETINKTFSTLLVINLKNKKLPKNEKKFEFSLKNLNIDDEEFFAIFNRYYSRAIISLENKDKI